MTPRQIELARHALGLPNRNNKSFRNRFIAGLQHPDYADWFGMVLDGNAEWRSGEKVPFGNDWLFWLTPAGAQKALRPGEQLDKEDFPDV